MLAVALVAVSCDEDEGSGSRSDKESDRETIVGHWVHDRDIYTYCADGTFQSGYFDSYGTYCMEESGTYVYNGIKLTKNTFEGEELGNSVAVVVRADSLAVENSSGGNWFGLNRLSDEMYNQLLDIEEVPEREIVGYWTGYEKPKPGNIPDWAFSFSADGRFENIGRGGMPKLEGSYKLSGRWLTMSYSGDEWGRLKVAVSASTLVWLRPVWENLPMQIWYLRRISKDEYNQVLRRYDLL